MAHLKLTRKALIFASIIIVLLGIPLTLILMQHSTDNRQHAAASADLVVKSVQLTDAGGNVKSVFNVNEDIYVRVELANIGGAAGNSTDGITSTAIYGNRPTTVAFNDITDRYIDMHNGEFSAGSAYLYVSTYGSPTQFRFTIAPQWRGNNPGPHTARVFINYNKHVTESNYDNNQVAIPYTIAGSPTYTTGSVSSTPPSGFDSGYCYINDPNLVSGLQGCVMDKSVSGYDLGMIKNTGSTTRTVGLASYKAYFPYPNPYPTCDPATCPANFNWIWTQTVYGGVTASLSPGQTIYLKVPVPSCAWQTDVFEGNISPSFIPPTSYYSGQGKYLDGFYQTANAVCTPVVPAVTPTNTPVPPTPTPTKVPTPTPTKVPTPTPTKVPTPTPTRIPTPTPTKVPTPTPTKIPTPTPTRAPTPTFTPTPTPRPTSTPIPTATPVPQATKFAFTLFMHGIGHSGDNSNPSAYTLSNQKPVHPQRPVTVQVINASNQLVLTKTGLVNYQATNGNFVGTIDMGTTLTSGSYTVKIKGEQYLNKLIPGIQSITAGVTNTLAQATLVTGDVNNDNKLDILDYNIIVGCYSDFAPAQSCTAAQKLSADLTDDGNVNQFDYNLFLRDLSVQSGD
jgi:hypothetical protein